MPLNIKFKKQLIGLLSIVMLAAACTNDSDSFILTGEYTGTGSITVGLGDASVENLYPAGGRVSPVGTITALDGTEWTVPADNNYTNNDFPFAPDLYNPDGTRYASSAEALAAFDASNVIEVDPAGELITGYIFAFSVK